MKKLALITTIALTASIAVASSDINLRKVNKVIRKAVASSETQTIKSVGFEIGEDSKFDSIETLDGNILFQATARNSVWSKKETTLEAGVALKTLNSDAENSMMQAKGTISSSTEAVKLYAYVAQKLQKYLEESPSQSPLYPQALAVLKEAAQTTTLNPIAPQIQKGIALLKLDAVDYPSEHNDPWIKVLNNLKVETTLNGANTTGLTIKIVAPVVFEDVSLNQLAFKMSDSGVGLTADVSFSESTQAVAQYLEQMVDALKQIQTGTPEIVQDLQEMAKSYMQIAEGFVQDNN